ncbi:hypothetical protein F0562_011945 [Nyssa sinensis]|uniref:Apple domain-containing protein n=1 Tax=Nyssa sinensis TaxID=561372 RepID=A0A5J4ZU83_9ASTE|nr:hypothetical protein F0562_011945 [Nyssa sinensis]
MALDYQGYIYDSQTRPVMVKVDLCYGYNTNGGCELWDQPNCGNGRNSSLRFELISGSFGIFFSVLPDNRSLSDCRAKCWNDCDCIGFQSFPGGCVYWNGDLEFFPDVTDASPRRYVLISQPPPTEPPLSQPLAMEPPLTSNNTELNAGGMAKRVRIIVPTVLVPVLLVLLSAILCYLRKRRIGLQGDDERRQEKVLREFMTSIEFMAIDELENDGHNGRDLKVFSFVSIMAATNGFSIESKLGEGGFGPVYKVCFREENVAFVN